MGESAACGLHCIKMNNIGVKFGREVVLKNVNIHVHCGQLTVIIGRNGARQNYFTKSHFRRNRTHRKHYFYGYEKEYNQKNKNRLCAPSYPYRKTYANYCI